MTNPRPFVHRENFEAILHRAGLSEGDLGRAIGMSPQAVNAMARGIRPASPRFVRDAPLLIAPHLNDVDPDLIRSVILTACTGGPGPDSLLARRLAATTGSEG